LGRAERELLVITRAEQRHLAEAWPRVRELREQRCAPSGLRVEVPAVKELVLTAKEPAAEE
jgi:hypothetical protein